MDALMSGGVTYMLQNRAEGHGLQLFCKIMSKYTHVQIFLIAAGANKTDSSCLSVLPSRPSDLRIVVYFSVPQVLTRSRYSLFTWPCG